MIMGIRVIGMIWEPGWVPVCTGTTVGFPGFPRRAGEGGFQTRPYGVVVASSLNSLT